MNILIQYQLNKYNSIFISKDNYFVILWVFESRYASPFRDKTIWDKTIQRFYKESINF